MLAMGSIMDIEEERLLADKMVRLFEARFKEDGSQSLPLQAVAEWRDILSAASLDLDRTKALLEKIVPSKSRYEIAFFTFCNQVEAVYRDQLRAFLESGGGAKR